MSLNQSLLFCSCVFCNEICLYLGGKLTFQVISFFIVWGILHGVMVGFQRFCPHQLRYKVRSKQVRKILKRAIYVFISRLVVFLQPLRSRCFLLLGSLVCLLCHIVLHSLKSVLLLFQGCSRHLILLDWVNIRGRWLISPLVLTWHLVPFFVCAVRLIPSKPRRPKLLQVIGISCAYVQWYLTL